MLVQYIRGRDRKKERKEGREKEIDVWRQEEVMFH